ncbi:glycerol-3-phosphate 1-O-acyltransferase PlsY [Desertifilum sp. FACHB-1129]|uniref:Glycerol-3-phosphate acyltransferase n=1 Tax=Desertifilum tharense IPPAS B-1220 TaxID=1781255 RepID=A0A1E5QGZ6_9CYAN|nr:MULTISPECIES: glycerol-3-phosphate 1-O-acyltransferase PlsY [Desertifilum]MDA0209617.1 glycerol-3-phosphate 1-O-acyltransferase PlsY [Cyanobacteria bacterium FC1]MBD2313027.1 glycerol-3-phosphate 1-O-acyltransferase PlsY [Desertifilum sp. FACHB-1129]MBD2320927.1 glycerol-3-phosphate 1-O-acyltransferase PlsY [Desertifilum sp. FACHB-866]MBD2331056.1 glycerol-3-phosphate 1-O-acyltransferase PlsY [Desertifilum sp. FACHB-868]OEJ73871.1 acyl-phosphate glycerol 3-phosphate acyltransferase [Deserti
MTNEILINGGLFVAAYLLGSIPIGYLLGRWLKGVDLREVGSGSTGATNVLRTLGKGPAAIVLLVDIGKGAAAIALVKWAYSLGLLASVAAWQPWMVTLAGLAAVIGHSKSIWLNFKGGKSVAASLGILLAMSWQVGLATVGVFAAVLAVSRIVSLSSIAGAIAVSALMVLLHQPLAYQLFGLVGGLFVLWRHRSNMQRLLAGTEPQLGQSVPQTTSESPAD